MHYLPTLLFIKAYTMDLKVTENIFGIILDPDRCGILKIGLRDDFGFRSYIKFALSIPMVHGKEWKIFGL